jgi:hypothetical protein
MTHEELEICDPPDPQRVARRAMILAALVCRCNSDHDPTNPDAVALWERLKQWLDGLDLGNEMEPAERDIIYAPLGSLAEPLRIRTTWQAEALGILAWALQRCPFPQHSQKIDPFELTDCLDFLHEDAAKIIRHPKLLPRRELDACRELLYAMHCRVRAFLRDKDARSVADWFEPEWLEILGINSPLGRMGDLTIGESELHESAPQNVNEFEWAVCERHRAIVWLVGEGGPLYSEVTADT